MPNENHMSSIHILTFQMMILQGHKFYTEIFIRDVINDIANRLLNSENWRRENKD